MVTGRQHLDFNLPSTAILKLSIASTTSFFPGCGFSNNLTVEIGIESRALFYRGFLVPTQIRLCNNASLHFIPYLVSLKPTFQNSNLSQNFKGHKFVSHRLLGVTLVKQS